MAIEIRDQYDKIYRYCYHKVKNAVLAEDLTQETFLRFFSQTSYSEIGKQLPYLYTIARNLCTDHFRLRTFEHVLPEDEQELLLLRYVNELTVSELSEITGLSRFAVYRKTKTALEHLKTRLRKEDFS